ncbi:MAG: type II secretion system secretin GspD [Candidatus Nitrospinota bacterium M3_3B_026]
MTSVRTFGLFVIVALSVLPPGPKASTAQDTLSSPASREAAATPPLPKPGEKVNIDFNEADIKVVAKFIAELTGRNFVIDEKVRGKVTIISPKKVTAEEAMRVFESTLEVYGYTLVEAGAVTKIIPATEARQRGSFTTKPSQPGDRMVIRLIPLKYVKADEMVNILRPLVPPYSYITAYSSTNTLILADYESNAAKIVGITERLDAPGHEEVVSVVHLNYAGAKETAEKLEKLYGDGGRKLAQRGRPSPPGAPPGAQEAGEPQIIPDDRINALIVVASRKQTDQIISLIEQLDIKPPVGSRRINVYYLKNADAEEIAKVLNNITGEKGAAAPGKPGQPPTGAVRLGGEVSVTPDRATNSLVITASVEDYETLTEVIEKLDTRRSQVFVEALIMEVTTDKTRQFGVEWRTTSNFTESGVQGIGGTNFGNINTVAQDPLSAPPGLTIGVVDGVISYAGKEFLNLGALIHALQAETGINILSTPNIMTTDNEEAEIMVGQNVPFVTGQSQSAGGTTLTTIERKNIGITLRITPQISESDNVKLNVYQEISSIAPTQLEKAKDLITFTRSVKTTVIVHDEQNIVLGGLIRDDTNDSESKVPGLGDVPLFGWLFKAKSKKKQKTNLLVFLTPHIIRSDTDVDRITSQRSELMEMAPEAGEFGGAVQERKNGTPAPEEEEKAGDDDSPGIWEDPLTF